MELEPIALRVGWGDPRPILGSYLVTNHSNHMMFAFKEDAEIFATFSCTADGERILEEYPGDADRLKKETDKTFVLFIIQLSHKSSCSDTEDKIHSVTVVYNRRTKQAFLYDLLRYHVRWYKIRALRMYVEQALRRIVRDEKVVVVDIVSTKTRLIVQEAVGEDPRHWYPLLIVWETHTMVRFPSKNAKEIVPEMLAGGISISVKRKFEQLKKLVKKVYDGWDGHCKDIEQVWSAETAKCIAYKGAESSSFEYTQVVYPRIRKPTVEITLEDINDYGISMVSSVRLMSWYLSKTYPVHSCLKELFLFRWEPRNDKFKLVVPIGIVHALEEGLRGRKPIYFFLISSAIGFLSSHMNCILIDPLRKTVEHFEPHGSDIADQEGAEFHRCYQALRTFFARYALDYHSPVSFLPDVAFPQIEEDNELDNVRDEGACAIWCVWYLELRFANWEMDRDELLRRALRKLKREGNLSDYIRNYERGFIPMLKAMKDDNFKPESWKPEEYYKL